ncbi:BLOC-1-related complex subunit 8 isoform X2 [Anas platyrhynchos]|uniref:BLOC-1-related complex subunit 8 isoform X2 n=1 Tax=Anas platyrhynchos TaxID=8839 RepID=UPI0018D7D5DE|nr:BLOC-1-related complex subunit 8 isoform X2 [Anas platyrhynchos]
MEEPEMQLKLRTSSRRACTSWPTSPPWRFIASRSTSGDRFQSSLSTSLPASPALGAGSCSDGAGQGEASEPFFWLLPLCLLVHPRGEGRKKMSDMQSWEEQSQGAIYTVEYACSAIKNMTDSSVYFKSIDSLLKHAIAMKDQLNAAQGRSTAGPQAKNPPASS